MDDQRDYAEEAAVRRDIEREGQQELAAEHKPAKHSLTPGDIARLDQIAEHAKADLDGVLGDPAIQAALAEDGPTIAAARLTLALDLRFDHMACAGLAAFAILRLIQGGDRS